MKSAMRSSVWVMAVMLLCWAPFGRADSVTLQLNSPPSNNVLDGIYVGPYSATNTQTGAQTQIICDDFKDESNYNQYTYNISSFGNFNNTLWGPGAATQYKEAAWLTLGLLNQTGATQGYYSYAAWAIFDPTDVLNWLKGYNDLAACNAVFGTGNNCSSTNVSAGGLIYSAQQNYGSQNYSNFQILTPTGGCTPISKCAEQEFFQLSPVPEGGAALPYLLFAGIACFGAIFHVRRQRTRESLT